MAEGAAVSEKAMTVTKLAPVLHFSPGCKVLPTVPASCECFAARRHAVTSANTKTMDQRKAAAQHWKAVCPDLRVGDFLLLTMLGLKGWKAKGNSLADFQRPDLRTGKPILWSVTLKCFVEAREETLLRKHLPAMHGMTKQEVLALAKTFSVEKPMKAQPGSDAHRALLGDARNLAHEAQVLLQTAPVSAEMIARDSMSHLRMAQKLLVQSFTSIGLSPQQPRSCPLRTTC